MKKKHILVLLSLIILCLMLFQSCGSNSNNNIKQSNATGRNLQELDNPVYWYECTKDNNIKYVDSNKKEKIFNGHFDPIKKCTISCTEHLPIEELKKKAHSWNKAFEDNKEDLLFGECCFYVDSNKEVPFQNPRKFFHPRNSIYHCYYLIFDSRFSKSNIACYDTPEKPGCCLFTHPEYKGPNAYYVCGKEQETITQFENECNLYDRTQQ